jgi:hypothetical protein
VKIFVEKLLAPNARRKPLKELGWAHHIALHIDSLAYGCQTADLGGAEW